MDDQSRDSLNDYISNVIELLYPTDLDNNMWQLLHYYVDAYNQTLEEFHNNPNEEIEKRLDLLKRPLDYINEHFPDNDERVIPSPVVDYIKKNIINKGTSIENAKPLVRSLNSGIPNILPEEAHDKYSINGFSYAIIIVLVTILLGIGLGILLHFIQ